MPRLLPALAAALVGILGSAGETAAQYVVPTYYYQPLRVRTVPANSQVVVPTTSLATPYSLAAPYSTVATPFVLTTSSTSTAGSQSVLGDAVLNLLFQRMLDRVLPPVPGQPGATAPASDCVQKQLDAIHLELQRQNPNYQKPACQTPAPETSPAPGSDGAGIGAIPGASALAVSATATGDLGQKIDTLNTNLDKLTQSISQLRAELTRPRPETPPGQGR